MELLEQLQLEPQKDSNYILVIQISTETLYLASYKLFFNLQNKWIYKPECQVLEHTQLDFISWKPRPSHALLTGNARET